MQLCLNQLVSQLVYSQLVFMVIYADRLVCMNKTLAGGGGTVMNIHNA